VVHILKFINLCENDMKFMFVICNKIFLIIFLKLNYHVIQLLCGNPVFNFLK
jgi:hypothetical protein